MLGAANEMVHGVNVGGSMSVRAGYSKSVDRQTSLYSIQYHLAAPCNARHAWGMAGWTGKWGVQGQGQGELRPYNSPRPIPIPIPIFLTMSWGASFT
jgi:hypothetical protein